MPLLAYYSAHCLLSSVQTIQYERSDWMCVHILCVAVCTCTSQQAVAIPVTTPGCHAMPARCSVLYILRTGSRAGRTRPELAAKRHRVTSSSLWRGGGGSSTAAAADAGGVTCPCWLSPFTCPPATTTSELPDLATRIRCHGPAAPLASAGNATDQFLPPSHGCALSVPAETEKRVPSRTVRHVSSCFGGSGWSTTAPDLGSRMKWSFV